MQRRKISRALISVSDKTGILELARALRDAQIEIIASDGTATYLRNEGIELRTVTEVTGAPELLGGKVKTLHPVIHASILANPDDSHERSELIVLGPIDAVIVNLYPMPGFDIGGPALIRAAAKNCEFVSVLTHPSQYGEFIAGLSDGFSAQQRELWARSALVLTSEYDLQLAAQRGIDLRYGENPHQSASLIPMSHHGVAGATVLQGKQMSFNNYLDLDAAWKISTLYDGAVAIVKHGIPSGVACASDIAHSYQKAFACDPLSAFGGVVAANGEIDERCATLIVKNFTEVVAATGYTQEARDVLASKPNLRILQISATENTEVDARRINGGILVQDRDFFQTADDLHSWTLVAGNPADTAQQEDLEFAWKVAAMARSNAIVIAKDRGTLGIGAGQVNRLDAARSACVRATTHSSQQIAGSVAASDAFFPFPDALEILITAGVTAVVHPGGSINDAAVIAAAQKAGITMYVTGTRHFSH